MKDRVTLTVDPKVMQKAKGIAHARRTSVSALVEELVRQTRLLPHEKEVSFVDRWAGKFRVRKSRKPDARLDYLKKHFGLEDT